jgi:diguanylate cyclase (GGDEF)-like protein
MDEIRSELNSIKTEEMKLLDERKGTYFEHENYYFYMNAAWSVTAVGLLLILIIKLQAKRQVIEAQRDTAIIQSITDGLTGLYNRPYFDLSIDKMLSASKRYSHPLSIIMLDIDLFKQINDEHGHLAGDAVLKQLASILSSSIRNNDFAARYGGEEFVVLLPDTDIESAMMVAEKIREKIYKVYFEGVDHKVSISAGVSELSPSIGEASQLIANADAALYHAKRSGRNRVVNYYSESPPHF